MKEEEDFLFDEEEPDFMEEEKVNPLVTAGVFLALVVVAAIICALLWSFTHKDDETEGSVSVAETVTDVPAESEASDDMTADSGQAGAETVDSEAMDNETIDAETVEAGTAETESTDTEAEVADSDESMTEAAGESGSDNILTEENGEVSQEQEPISGNESMSFAEIADTVTAKDVTNLRSVPSTLDSENVVSQLLNGESIARTGVNEDTGWSRLDYNGQTLYAVTQYLTTDLTYKPPVAPSDPNRISTQDGRIIIFTNCDDNVTPKEYVNLRVEPSTSQGETTVRCQISNGTIVHRTGYSPDAGWSRVEYNGEVLYVVSSMVNSSAAQE